MRRDLWCPFPSIKAQTGVIHLDHVQRSEEWLKPCWVLAHTLGHELKSVPQKELPRSVDPSLAETLLDGGPSL